MHFNCAAQRSLELILEQYKVVLIDGRPLQTNRHSVKLLEVRMSKVIARRPLPPSRVPQEDTLRYPPGLETPNAVKSLPVVPSGSNDVWRSVQGVARPPEGRSVFWKDHSTRE